MKNTFILLTVLSVAVWGGTSLWLSGFEEGYMQGEEAAWNRANRMMNLAPASAGSLLVEKSENDGL